MVVRVYSRSLGDDQNRRVVGVDIGRKGYQRNVSTSSIEPGAQ